MPAQLHPVLHGRHGFIRVFSSEPTKRNILGIVGRFYDPLGYLAPITMCFKIFFQKLCEFKAGWDEPLPSELMLEWKMLIDDFYGTLLSIARSYCSDHERGVSSRFFVASAMHPPRPMLPSSTSSLCLRILRSPFWQQNHEWPRSKLR